MAFCENCGERLPDGAKFCRACGTPVPVDDVIEMNASEEEPMEAVAQPMETEQASGDAPLTPEAEAELDALEEKAAEESAGAAEEAFAEETAPAEEPEGEAQADDAPVEEPGPAEGTSDAGESPAVIIAPPQAEAPAAEAAPKGKRQSAAGIVAFCMAMTKMLALPSLIVGIVDLAKKKDTVRHGLAKAAVIISSIVLVADLAIAAVIGLFTCKAVEYVSSEEGQAAIESAMDGVQAALEDGEINIPGAFSFEYHYSDGNGTVYEYRDSDGNVYEYRSDEDGEENEAMVPSGEHGRGHGKPAGEEF